MDANQYKQIMRRFATGVMVLTVPEPNGMHALTVNSVTSVSLEPLLVLVCIQKDGRSHELVHRAGVFALNILADDQRALGERFAFDREARAHPERYVEGEAGANGALIFHNSLGFLECRVTAEYPGGDHTIFVGQVTGGNVKPVSTGPLLYYASRWLKLGALQDAPR